MPLSERDDICLLSLPYIVGIMVSHADDEEGEYDDELEMRALERILIAYAHEKQLSPFVNDVVLRTISSKDQWQGWVDRALSALPQCKHAINVITQEFGKEEARNYARMLLDVGEAVAMAYGEFGMGDFDDDNEGVLSRFIGKFSAKIKGEKPNNDEDSGLANISAAEQAALDRLAEALSWEDLKAA